MNKYKITIIVPIYNCEKYLQNCLSSLIKQTYKNIEVLLIDDGSTDNSLNICVEYANRDNRFKVINKKNGGVGSARNLGLELATGDYIGFVDGDDEIEYDMYELLINNSLIHNSEISICGYFDVRTDKTIIVGGQGKINILNKFEAIEEFFKSNYTYPIVCNKIFKKEIVKELRFEKYKINEDGLFTFSALCKTNKVVYDDSPKYKYIKRENSATQSKFSLDRVDFIYANKKILDKTKLYFPQYELIAHKKVILIYFDIIDNIVSSKNKNFSKKFLELTKELNEDFKRNIKNNYLSNENKLSLLIIKINPYLYRFIYFPIRKLYRNTHIRIVNLFKNNI